MPAPVPEPYTPIVPVEPLPNPLSKPIVKVKKKQLDEDDLENL